MKKALTFFSAHSWLSHHMRQRVLWSRVTSSERCGRPRCSTSHDQPHRSVNLHLKPDGWLQPAGLFLNHGSHIAWIYGGGGVYAMSAHVAGGANFAMEELCWWLDRCCIGPVLLSFCPARGQRKAFRRQRILGVHTKTLLMGSVFCLVDTIKWVQKNEWEWFMFAKVCSSSQNLWC